MKKKFKVDGNTDKLAEQYFWLAFQACGGPVGMGILQDRGGVTPQQVFENVRTNGDYLMGPHGGEGDYYGDYVFGRMMKTGMVVNGDVVEVNSAEPRSDYQAWAGTYPSYEALLIAAAEAAEVSLEPIEEPAEA